LGKNKLNALHPEMFSHLSNLDKLSLFGNTCVDKTFGRHGTTPIAEIKKFLGPCEEGYWSKLRQMYLDTITKTNKINKN
jgi:hypothetical protein